VACWRSSSAWGHLFVEMEMQSGHRVRNGGRTILTGSAPERRNRDCDSQDWQHKVARATTHVHHEVEE
jgi:hypothetical protein